MHTGGEPSAMDHSGRGTWAGRWSIFLGACLALIAAGSFVAFSLVASDAGRSGMAGRIEARRLATTSPVVTLGEPPGNEEAGSGRTRRVGPAPAPADIVLVTQLFSGPASSSVPKTTERAHKPRRATGTDQATPPATARPVSSGKPKTGEPKTSKPHKGGPKNKSRSSSGPKGEAKGHDKARGKGHDKHPGDH